MAEWWQDQGSLPFAANRAVRSPAGLLVVEPTGGLIAAAPVIGRKRDGSMTGFATPVIHTLAELLVEARPPLECFASVRIAGSFAIVAISGGSTGRTSFVVEPHVLHKVPWEARQVELPADVAGTRIVACAGGDHALYVALQGGSIRKWRFPAPGQVGVWSWVPETGMTIPGPEGSRQVEALAVGRLDHREVLYVVSGDTIYRFGADGTPDYRLEAIEPDRSE